MRYWGVGRDLTGIAALLALVSGALAYASIDHAYYWFLNEPERTREREEERRGR